MAFGKRAIPPSGKQPNSSIEAVAAAKVALTSPIFLERAASLKDHLDRIYLQAVGLATAIKEARPVVGQELAAVGERESFPIDIAGLAHHFNFMRAGRLKHGVYLYIRADGVLDRAAQLHLLDLTSAIMRLNETCLAACAEGALAVAIQAEAVRADVDRTIVLSGFLAVMLSNMIDTEYERQTGGKIPTMNRLLDALDNQGDRARRAMLDPSLFRSLAPNFEWPLMLVEEEAEDHPGQLIVNQIYLPADIAVPMRQILAREQAHALVVRAAA